MRVNAVAGATCGADGSTNVEGAAEWHDPHPQSNVWCELTAAETVGCCVVPVDDVALIAPPSEPHVITVDSAPSAASSSGSKPLQPRHQRVMTAVVARMARMRWEGRRIIRSSYHGSGTSASNDAVDTIHYYCRMVK